MDIVEYVKDPAQFIANALNPAEVLDVIFSEPEASVTEGQSEEDSTDASVTENTDAATETENTEEEEPVATTEERSCTVVVPDSQLSLAIGKRGQNARLAARLTKYKIDIKPASEMENNTDTLEKETDASED